MPIETVIDLPNKERREGFLAPLMVERNMEMGLLVCLSVALLSKGDFCPGL